jgi:hypothetical protein
MKAEVYSITKKNEVVSHPVTKKFIISSKPVYFFTFMKQPFSSHSFPSEKTCTLVVYL